MDRRKWIERAAIGSIVSAVTYSFLEAKWCRVRRVPRRIFCRPEIVLLTLTGRPLA